MRAQVLDQQYKIGCLARHYRVVIAEQLGCDPAGNDWWLLRNQEQHHPGKDAHDHQRPKRQGYCRAAALRDGPALLLLSLSHATRRHFGVRRPPPEPVLKPELEDGVLRPADTPKFRMLALLRSLDDGEGVDPDILLSEAERTGIPHPQLEMQKLVRRGILYIHEGLCRTAA